MFQDGLHEANDVEVESISRDLEGCKFVDVSATLAIHGDVPKILLRIKHR